MKGKIGYNYFTGIVEFRFYLILVPMLYFHVLFLLVKFLFYQKRKTLRDSVYQLSIVTIMLHNDNIKPQWHTINIYLVPESVD